MRSDLDRSSVLVPVPAAHRRAFTLPAAPAFRCLMELLPSAEAAATGSMPPFRAIRRDPARITLVCLPLCCLWVVLGSALSCLWASRSRGFFAVVLIRLFRYMGVAAGSVMSATPISCSRSSHQLRIFPSAGVPGLGPIQVSGVGEEMWSTLPY